MNEFYIYLLTLKDAVNFKDDIKLEEAVNNINKMSLDHVKDEDEINNLITTVLELNNKELIDTLIDKLEIFPTKDAYHALNDVANSNVFNVSAENIKKYINSDYEFYIPFHKEMLKKQIITVVISKNDPILIRFVLNKLSN